MTAFMAKNATSTIDQPPESSNLVPCDFFLFRKLKLPLRRTPFDLIEAIKHNSCKELKVIPESAYKKCFENWKKRWNICIVSNGTYFGVDKININV